MIDAEFEGPDLTYHDLHDTFFQCCDWHHLVVRNISKKRIKACRLDIRPCPEEGTEKVWTIAEDYYLCPEHKRVWDGLVKGEE